MQAGPPRPLFYKTGVGNFRASLKLSLQPQPAKPLKPIFETGFSLGWIAFYLNTKLRVRDRAHCKEEPMTYVNTLICKAACLRSDRRAVTALEYGLIASLVALAIVTSVTTLGTNMSKEFTTIAGKL
jgi:pilus assembly protein Flp/PilA